MDEGVVEGSLDVADSKVQLILVLGLRAGGAVVDDLLFTYNLWWLLYTERGRLDFT